MRTHSHDNKETGTEAAKVEDGAAGALDKVIRVGTAAADPVGHGGQHVGGDDEQGEVRVEEGAGQDDEEEADCQDEGEGNDGLEAGGRHGGREATGFDPWESACVCVFCVASSLGWPVVRCRVVMMRAR